MAASDSRAWRAFERVAIVVVLLVSLTMVVERVTTRSRAATGVQAAPRTSLERPEASVPAEPVSVEGVSFKGSPSAPVMLIEFIDFECPACAQFATEVLPELERDYVATGKVRFGVWHRPLRMHRNASLAAAAAECATREGKFWPVHDRFFANVRDLGPENIERLAGEAGAGGGLQRCLADGAVHDRVKAATAAAQTWQVLATPTTFLGVVQADGRVQVQRRWSGVRQPANIAGMIDEALASVPLVHAR